MKKLTIAAALIFIGAAVFFFTNRAPTPLTPSSPQESPSINNPIAPTPFPTVEKKEEFNLSQCSPLAEPSPTASLQSHLLAKLEPQADQLDWRVIRLESAEGEVRLRLSREEGQLELRVFTVDREGLPILRSRIKCRGAEAKMAELARGGRVVSEIESKTSSADGYLRVEKENGELVELEYRSPKGRLACAGKEKFACRCL